MCKLGIGWRCSFTCEWEDGKLQFPFRIGGTIDSSVFSKGNGDKDVDAVQNRR